MTHLVAGRRCVRPVEKRSPKTRATVRGTSWPVNRLGWPRDRFVFTPFALALACLLGATTGISGRDGVPSVRGSGQPVSQHTSRPNAARPVPHGQTAASHHAPSQPKIPALFARFTQRLGPSVFDEPYERTSPAYPETPRVRERILAKEHLAEELWGPHEFEEEAYFAEGGAWHSSPGAVEGFPCGRPLSAICWDSWEGFAGVQGFTGPLNRGSTGSFGFHQGMNWGRPLPLLFGDAVAGQLGVRAVQSNFRGAEFTADERRQVFLTGGLFRRVDWGLQGGVVLDYLHESWYLQADFVQIRGELSWVFPAHHELGFWFSANSQNQTVETFPRGDGSGSSELETFEGTDLYAIFYRFRADECGGATGRVFAGFTGQSGGLLGADWALPVNANWALESAFTYLIPQESRGLGGHIDDAWNVGLSLVWRPGGGFARRDYARPLMDVASNGTFFVNRR